MPGSGKSLVLNAASESGYSIIVMGDIIREETRKRGFEPTPTNVGQTMLRLRGEEGKGVVAKRCIPKIEAANSQRIFVDGLRSLDEAEEFRKHFPDFSLIAIHSSPETRFKRLWKRRRSDDPPNWETFRERDARELSVGLGNAIAMATHMIINEEDPQTVKRKINQTLKEAEAKWKK
jgi:dephospho-CoA kinase